MVLYKLGNTNSIGNSEFTNNPKKYIFIKQLKETEVVLKS